MVVKAQSASYRLSSYCHNFSNQKAPGIGKGGHHLAWRFLAPQHTTMALQKSPEKRDPPHNILGSAGWGGYNTQQVKDRGKNYDLMCAKLFFGGSLMALSSAINVSIVAQNFNNVNYFIINV